MAVALDIIIQFVEGKMTVEEFQKELQTNSGLIEILSENIAEASAHLTRDSLYDYIKRCNTNTLGGLVDILGELRKFLVTQQVTFKFNEEPRNLFGLMLDSMPAYLDMDVDVNSTFFINQIVPIIEQEITKTEKKKQIREKFKSLFQYQSKPPRWIQSPEWLTKGDTPLFFVGQVDLKHSSFHDNGAVYVFLDTKSGEIKTVQQFY